ncbi:hypothetical protein AS593_06525 [Caulobacter vibrioides]|nr:hypothetical protein AS593_06525 [Caulobacter vibrioides]
MDDQSNITPPAPAALGIGDFLGAIKVMFDRLERWWAVHGETAVKGARPKKPSRRFWRRETHSRAFILERPASRGPRTGEVCDRLATKSRPTMRRWSKTYLGIALTPARLDAF